MKIIEQIEKEVCNECECNFTCIDGFREDELHQYRQEDCIKCFKYLENKYNSMLNLLKIWRSIDRCSYINCYGLSQFIDKL